MDENPKYVDMKNHDSSDEFSLRKRVELDLEISPELKFGEETEVNIEEAMLEDHTYPSPENENFQTDIYRKRDFYKNAIPARKKLESYDEIREFRDNVCARDFKLNEHQAMLSNFINPNTPYTGLLLFHGTGTGKSCASIAIAEKFKPIVEKYGTKIHVLVPGPLNKQNFMNEILKCTDETYIKMFTDKTVVMNEYEKTKIRKNALLVVNNYYKVMSYRSFYKKVLGEKISEQIKGKDNKLKSSYKKTDTGEYERDLSIDRIEHLDNGLLIIDEAHNLTGNEYGDAVKKIIEKSVNLKIILLTATPMKNLADDIIELINYLRPVKHPMLREKIFTGVRGHQMEFKPGGKEYLRNMVRGYVSYLRGADPMTFAERVDIGEIPKGLSFTKVIRCFMEPFQLEAYKYVVENFDDSLDKKSEAVANFAFPGLSKDKNRNIIGYYGIEGMNEVKSQLKHNSDALVKKIASTILKDYTIEDPSTLIYLTDGGKSISGDIFHEKYLKHFSTKFYTALQKINNMVYGKDGTGLGFIYSNLVRVGIELFQEIMLRNGYLEYQENMSNYSIKNDTRCYFCGNKFIEHQHSSSKVPKHKFYPATFITVTGKTEDSLEQIPEEKHKILRNVFNHVENKDGKFIKFVLGSKVMNEGITLKNIKTIDVLDVHFNLGKVDQVIGRGIRWCVHYDIVSEDNPFPKVYIRKYVVSLKGEISSEEELYRKAEEKYKLIKETERILQEEAIDCPLNRNGNVFPEELEKYAKCGSKDNPCPPECGYMPCDFKCGDKLLNAKYYDPDRNIYRKLSKSELDYSTYDNSLADEETEYAKIKIKELFKKDNVYTLSQILEYVKKSYPEDKRELFDDFYVYQALNDMIPITSNDFNNFKDTLINKINQSGYLIYRDRYYIFNPFNEPETVPMYYRRNYKLITKNKLPLRDYLDTVKNNEEFKHVSKFLKIDNNGSGYNFDATLDYYDARQEFDYVGIIDKKTSRKVTADDNAPDVFKLRKKRPKLIEKKRETGIPSFTGAVCGTTYDSKQMISIARKLGLKLSSKMTRPKMCELIMDRMFHLEKYSIGQNKNTYLMVPINHKTIPFPLNIEDRLQYVIDDIKKDTRIPINPKIKKIKIDGKYEDIDYYYYEITISENIDDNSNVIKKYGITKTKDKWILNIK